MMRRTRPPSPGLWSLAALVVGTLALAGCEKPYPGVTVWSGTNSEHKAALCWQPDPAQALGTGQCAEDVLQQASAGQGVPAIEVAPGDTVGISVDTVVARGGWTLKVAGQDLASDLTDTYYRFTFPEQGAVDPSGYSLQVQANGTAGTRGVWFFQLIPRQF